MHTARADILRDEMFRGATDRFNHCIQNRLGMAIDFPEKRLRMQDEESARSITFRAISGTSRGGLASAITFFCIRVAKVPAMRDDRTMKYGSGDGAYWILPSTGMDLL